jgi:hypothetical protein
MTELEKLTEQVNRLETHLDAHTVVLGILIGQLTEGGTIRGQDLRTALVFHTQSRPRNDPAWAIFRPLIDALPR